MNAEAFLIARKIKNRIKEALHRPSEIIVGILLFAVIIFTAITGNAQGQESVLRDTQELYAIILALYALVFVLTAKNGFVNGASMFSMADVNLIFPSARSPMRVLTYGLFSQLGRSLMLGVFILYQYGWAHNAYGVSYGFLLAVVLGYALTVFLSQMLAMLIYSLTSGDDRRNKALKAVFYAVIAVFVLYAAYAGYQSENFLSGAVDGANTLVMKFFPIAGFVQLGVIGFSQGNYVKILIALACTAAFIMLYFVLIRVIHADYYEDVLKATEVSFSAITARKEGKAVETAPRNVKVGKTGFGKGEGASVIYQKHKIENRRGKVAFLDATTLLFAAITLVFAFVTKEALSAFVFSIYMSVFTVGTGRWAKELSLPYVYMIPEKPFVKLVNMLKEQIPSFVIEALITFLPMCFFAYDCTPIEASGYAIAKISFGFLFVSLNLLFQRIFGNGGSKALQITLYFLLAMVFSVPFIAVWIVLTNVFLQGVFVAALCGFAVNTAVAAVTLYCCRNVLQYAEFNNK